MSVCWSAVTEAPDAPSESDAAEAPAGAGIKITARNMKILRIIRTITDGYMKIVLLRERARGERDEQYAERVEGEGQQQKAARAHARYPEQGKPQLVGQWRSDDKPAYKRQYPPEGLAVEYLKKARGA